MTNQDQKIIIGNVIKVHKKTKKQQVKHSHVQKPNIPRTRVKIDFEDFFSNIIDKFRNILFKFINILGFTFSKRRFLLTLGIITILLPFTVVALDQFLHKYNFLASEVPTSIKALDSAPNVLGASTNSGRNNIAQSSGVFMDKREYVLEAYFRQRNSPLVGTGKIFVEACDSFGAPVDCISVAAIARHETDLCNYFISAQMHNCLGWGGGGEYRMTFPDFRTMIFTAHDVLVNQYGNAYMDDPRKMETVFCGPQDECIGWGARVLRFMREIDDLGVSLGVGRLTDLRTDGLRY